MRYISRKLCKLRGHINAGCYQGYVPDIFCDEVCASCGSTITTWAQIFKSLPKSQQQEIDKKYGTQNGVFK